MVIRADIFSGNVTQDEDEGIKGDTEDDDPAFPHPGIHKRHGSRRHGNLKYTNETSVTKLIFSIDTAL